MTLSTVLWSRITITNIGRELVRDLVTFMVTSGVTLNSSVGLHHVEVTRARPDPWGVVWNDFQVDEGSFR